MPYVTPGHPVKGSAGYDCGCGECLAGRQFMAAHPGGFPGHTLYICNDCAAGQCGLCIEANETEIPGPGCDCEHEDWDDEMAAVQPDPAMP